MLALPVLLLAGGFSEGDAERDLYAGGWHWRAAGTSLVEAALAATLPLFLIGWFREHWTRRDRYCGGWARPPMAPSSFTRR